MSTNNTSNQNELTEKERAHRQRQVRYLPSNIVLEEASTMPLVLWTIAVVCGIVFLLLIWAGFTKVKETAVTFGEVIPSGQIQVIQHLEGGIIEKVMIQDGAQVKKDQVLIKMSPAQAYSELQQTRSRQLALMLNVARLKAFINNENPDMNKWKALIMQSKFYNGKNQAEIDNVLADAQQHLALQRKSIEDQRSVLISQYNQREQDLAKVQQQQIEATTQMQLLQKEKKMYDDLGKNSPISQKDYLAILREINQTQGTLNQIPDQIKQAQAAMNETSERLKQLVSDANNTASKELNDVQSELGQVQIAAQKLEDRVIRLDVVAPMDGTIQGLTLKAGSVVQPGGKLMEIVPSNEKLVVKTRISTRDIGYVKPGDPVSVRVVTYDYSRYGAIEGKLKSISPTTFMDEKTNQPYYEGIVDLSKDYVGKDPKQNHLLPGMTVQANITTGEKSVLSYFLKPIKTTFTSSFKER